MLIFDDFSEINSTQFWSGHIASSWPDAAEEDEGGSTEEGDFDLVWVKPKTSSISSKASL